MTQKDKQAFYLALDAIADVHGLEMSATRKTAYFMALADLPLPAIVAACQQAIRSEKFFPVPATLRELAGFPTEVLPRAERAWLSIRNLATRYNREALADPLTRKVFDDMGGSYVLEWGFGNWPIEKEDQKRREFLSRYREAQQATALVAQQEKTNGHP